MTTVFCDGAGAERMGQPGGWAFVIVRSADEVLAEGSGAATKTSSLFMELTAAAEGLEAARKLGLDHVELATDCRIALDVATGAHLPKPPKYHPLCARLREAFLAVHAKAKWVKGHSGHRWNEEVDARAAKAREAGRETSTRRARNAE